MRKSSFIAFWVAVTIAAISFSFFSCQEKPKTDTAPAPNNDGPRTTTVDGFVVSYNKLEQVINATGNLIAYESVEIRPERAGKLITLNFQESATVQKGQLLAQIDDEDLQAQKNRLLINLDLAEKEVTRGRELQKIQGISEEEMDRLINRVADIKAEMDIIDVQIQKSRIVAPFSGTLGLRQVSQGAYITPSDVLVQLQQTSPIKLEFEVPERFATQVQDGQTLKFTIVGSEETFDARVYAIDTEISPTTRTFKVRASSQNKNGVLKPGQFAKVTLVTGINNKAILVPTDAVIPVLDGKQVFIVSKGRAIATKVETDERRAGQIEIVEGLKEGDTIILSGILSLSDGSRVEISKLIDQNKIEE